MFDTGSLRRCDDLQSQPLYYLHTQLPYWKTTGLLSPLSTPDRPLSPYGSSSLLSPLLTAGRYYGPRTHPSTLTTLTMHSRRNGLKECAYTLYKEGAETLHQRHIPDFTHTLLSAYLCHADVTIPSYSIIHIVSPNKLYLHDKSLPRAPQTQPHTTSNHTWNTATLIFISICDNYISKQ